MAKKEWVWLEEGDDWGVKYVAMVAHNENGTASRDRAIKIKVKEKCDVRWPDGTVGSVKLLLRRELTTVHDMGHEYRVESFMPGFKYEVNGLEIWIDLSKVQVRREWAEDRSPSLQD